MNKEVKSMLKELDKAELNMLMYKVSNMLRQKRIEVAVAAVRKSKSSDKRLMPYYQLLMKELTIGRQVLIDEYLEMIEAILDLEE